MTSTTAILIGIVIGATVVDFLWAWKFGIPQTFWYRIKRFFTTKFR